MGPYCSGTATLQVVLGGKYFIFPVSGYKKLRLRVADNVSATRTSSRGAAVLLDHDFSIIQPGLGTISQKLVPHSDTIPFSEVL